MGYDSYVEWTCDCCAKKQITVNTPSYGMRVPIGWGMLEFQTDPGQISYHLCNECYTEMLRFFTERRTQRRREQGLWVPEDADWNADKDE